MSYPQTDLVLFSVISRSSYHNIKSKWIPEIQHHVPEAPFIIVATKIDMRNNKDALAKVGADFKACTREECQALADELGAAGYEECSALTQDGLKEVFERAIRVHMGDAKPKGHFDASEAYQQLSMVELDYEREYNQDEMKEDEDKNIDRGFSQQKQLMIEEAIARKIKVIDDSMEDVMKYALNVMNSKRLYMYKDDIIKYCVEHSIDGKKLSVMGGDAFSDGFVGTYCHKENEKKELRKLLRELYVVIGQYGQYKELKGKMEQNHDNSCCACDCNFSVLQPSLSVYNRDILPNKLGLRWMYENEVNKQTKNIEMKEMEQQIHLNTKDTEEVKYIEEDDEDLDDYDEGGYIEISLNKDYWMTSTIYQQNKLLVKKSLIPLLHAIQRHDCIVLSYTKGCEG